jgi:hypothetical protein
MGQMQTTQRAVAALAAELQPMREAQRELGVLLGHFLAYMKDVEKRLATLEALRPEKDSPEVTE